MVAFLGKRAWVDLRSTAYAHALAFNARYTKAQAYQRLYRSLVVDRPIATSAGAGYDGTAFDLGTFYFHVSPRQGTDVAAAEAAMQAEIDKVLKDGVTEDEVKHAIERMQSAAIYARDDLSTGRRGKVRTRRRRRSCSTPSRGSATRSNSSAMPKW